MLLVALLTTPAAAQDAPSPLLVQHDEEFYTKGSYIAYAAPWSTQGTRLKAGEDFVDTIAVDPATFPARTRIAWHWPLVPDNKAGVRGYNAVGFGNYDSGVPQVPIKPQRVREIRFDSQSIDWSYDRVAGDFNMLAEFYLTRSPGAADDKAAEVGFMLHTPPATRAWTRKGEALGTWRDRFGISWEITRNQGPEAPYFVFIPTDGADRLTARIDVQGALAELRQLDQITGNEWLNGVAVGVEPITGSGSVTVNAWHVPW